MRFAGRSALLVGLATLLAPSAAHADAATPTEYRTTIVSVSPQVAGLEVSIEGGDAFMLLTAPSGAEVIVYGYAGEPYLRFAADDTIAQNRLSAATYENENRYGGTFVPGIVDATADPVWDEIATGRTWAWHDHRSHWMASEPPIGLEPGQSLPVQSISVTVDGRRVVIFVETTLVASPSSWPAAVGILLGLQLTLLGWWLGPATATLTTLVLSLAAIVTGGGQFLSLPSETGPSHLWWLIPVIALAAGIAAIMSYGRSDLLVRGLLAISGVQLVIWALMRRTALTRPVLPTDIAFWFDRATTGAALAGGAAITVLVIRSLVVEAVNPR